MSLLLICFVFYLIGSIPTAYILVKLKYKRQLTEEGSGNIGARNTYDVTKSKFDGIAVMILDYLKGLLPSVWFLYYSGMPAEQILFPAVLLVAGHNFSIWLKFKGGRGLATAAGIMTVIIYMLIVVWFASYFIFNSFIKNVHVSTVIAILILPLTVLTFGKTIVGFSNHQIQALPDPLTFLLIFCSAICFVILLKHISPLIDLYKKRRENII